MNKLFTCFSVLLLMASLTCVSMAKDSFILSASGLEYKDLKLGSGEKAQQGDIAVIHFRGWLNDNGRQGKEIFDSRKQEKSLSFKIGTDKVMRGWNEGVIGMQAGVCECCEYHPSWPTVTGQWKKQYLHVHT